MTRISCGPTVSEVRSRWVAWRFRQVVVHVSRIALPTDGPEHAAHGHHTLCGRQASQGSGSSAPARRADIGWAVPPRGRCIPAVLLLADLVTAMISSQQLARRCPAMSCSATRRLRPVTRIARTGSHLGPARARWSGPAARSLEPRREGRKGAATPNELACACRRSWTPCRRRSQEPRHTPTRKGRTRGRPLVGRPWSRQQ